MMIVHGFCAEDYRKDKRNIIFVEAKKNKPKKQQAEQPQELNLCEILKNCPQGETFWSPLLGDVKFYNVNQRDNVIYVTTKALITWKINAGGTITIDDITSEVIMLYPSRERCDWSTFKYEPKYRPFKTHGECWHEMLKHQPFGWIRSKKCKALLWNVTSINKDDITIICDYYKFHRAFECFEFTDGTPFGIKEE